MNLKLVGTTITMIVAGVVSASAFADQGQSSQAQMDAMRAQISQMQAAIDANNPGTGLASDGWQNRVRFSGLANIDLMGSTKYAPTDFATKDPSYLGISSAALFMDANVSDWTKAHLGILYADSNQSTFNVTTPGTHANTVFNNSRSLNLDEAYVTIGNFAKSPLFLKAGVQYLPFGSYNPYDNITPSTTQVLSEVNAPAAVVGLVANNGFNVSAYALDGTSKANSNNPNGGTRNTVGNYGANIAYTGAYNNVGIKAGLGYINNLADTDLVANIIQVGINDGYTTSVGGVAANLGLQSNAFDVSGKWVEAVKKFNPEDMINYNGQGARPSTWGAEAGYSFPVRAHDSRFSVGYQGSVQAQGAYQGGYQFPTDMPRSRYLVDYKVNVSKYTDLGFELRRDRSYAASTNTAYTSTTDKQTYTGAARIAVKFA